MSRIFITGICGFVGSALTRALLAAEPGLEIIGMDNFIRPGSENNRPLLAALGVKILHGDIRNTADLENLPPVDWVIDAAANPSVLAGVDGKTSSRQLVGHNLGGTIELLEFCRRHSAGLILLSTSRVYSIPPLAGLAVQVQNGAFVPTTDTALPPGLSLAGVDETFSTAPPVSLYGATKVASETLALEYGSTFGFPVWVNRCGVLAGAGQFGRADQGIFSFWIHSWARRSALKYIGFQGSGAQVRDAFHPDDLAAFLHLQMKKGATDGARIFNLGGGLQNSLSLAGLSDWCATRFGQHLVESGNERRPFDIPWMVMDSSLAQSVFGWSPQRCLDSILEEIAEHARARPDWLEISAG